MGKGVAPKPSLLEGHVARPLGGTCAPPPYSRKGPAPIPREADSSPLPQEPAGQRSDHRGRGPGAWPAPGASSCPPFISCPSFYFVCSYGFSCFLLITPWGLRLLVDLLPPLWVTVLRGDDAGAEGKRGPELQVRIARDPQPAPVGRGAVKEAAKCQRLPSKTPS